MPTLDAIELLSIFLVRAVVLRCIQVRVLNAIPAAHSFQSGEWNMSVGVSFESALEHERVRPVLL